MGEEPGRGLLGRLPNFSNSSSKFSFSQSGMKLYLKYILLLMYLLYTFLNFPRTLTFARLGGPTHVTRVALAIVNDAMMTRSLDAVTGIDMIRTLHSIFFFKSPRPPVFGRDFGDKYLKTFRLPLSFLHKFPLFFFTHLTNCFNP